MKKKHIVSF